MAICYHFNPVFNTFQIIRIMTTERQEAVERIPKNAKLEFLIFLLLICLTETCFLYLRTLIRTIPFFKVI